MCVISGIKWASRYLKTLENVMFVEQLVQTNNSDIIKGQHYCFFGSVINQWPMDSPHKGPVMQQHGTIIDSKTNTKIT